MALDYHPVRLESQTEGDAEGVFILDEDDDSADATLVLRYPGGEITGKASDFFDAMCRIRAIN